MVTDDGVQWGEMFSACEVLQAFIFTDCTEFKLQQTFLKKGSASEIARSD